MVRSSVELYVALDHLVIALGADRWAIGLYLFFAHTALCACGGPVRITDNGEIA